jgi:hypothetical protein
MIAEKRCGRCRELKPLDDFGKPTIARPGRDSYCKPCRRAFSREKRPRHSELSPEQRLRANCRSYVNQYKRRGRIKPKPCEKCGSEEHIEMHHEDYSKPLEINWLCRSCHLEMHRARKALKAAQEIRA